MVPSSAGKDLYRVLDAEGNVLDGVEVPALDDERLLRMYREMRLTRRFDERAVNLQRQGRIGTFPPAAGQEAAQIASTHALRDDDPICYQYREHGAVIVRGLSHQYLHYWMGYEEGCAWLADRHIFPINIAIGTQVPHATGIAWAGKYQGDDRVVACHFGDGATSEGDFHEGLNFAGVFDVPCVFICNNNGWAISVPREAQTASDTIAAKAAAYGLESVRVDGMDPLAVYNVMDEAVERARSPVDGENRPTLVEAVSYRFGAHTTADDPTAYRDKDEVEQWKRLDPIPRFEAFLRSRGLLDDERVDAIGSAVEDEVADLIERAEEIDPDPDAMFEYTYEQLPPGLEEQRARLKELRERHGDERLLEDE